MFDKEGPTGHDALRPPPQTVPSPIHQNHLWDSCGGIDPVLGFSGFTMSKAKS